MEIKVWQNIEFISYNLYLSYPIILLVFIILVSYLLVLFSSCHHLPLSAKKTQMFDQERATENNLNQICFFEICT